MRVLKSIGVICKLLYVELFLSKKETVMFEYANNVFSSKTKEELLGILNDASVVEKEQEKLWNHQDEVSKALLDNHLNSLRVMIKKQIEGVKDEKVLKAVEEKAKNIYESFDLQRKEIEERRTLAQNIGKLSLRFLTIYAYDACHGTLETKETLCVYAKELLDRLNCFSQQKELNKGYLTLNNDLEIYPILAFGFSMVGKCCKVLSFENSKESQKYLKMIDELHGGFDIFSRKTSAKLNEVLPASAQSENGNSLSKLRNWVIEFRKQSSFEKAMIHFNNNDDESLQRSIDDAYFALGESGLKKKVKEEQVSEGYVTSEFRNKVLPMIEQSRLAYSKMIKPSMN